MKDKKRSTNKPNKKRKAVTRKAERILFPLSVKYRLKKGRTPWLATDYENISGCGIAIWINTRVKPGDVIYLSFEFLDVGEKVNVTGRIVWNEAFSSGSIKTGIEFTDVTKRDFYSQYICDKMLELMQ